MRSMKNGVRLNWGVEVMTIGRAGRRMASIRTEGFEEMKTLLERHCT